MNEAIADNQMTIEYSCFTLYKPWEYFRNDPLQYLFYAWALNKYFTQMCNAGMENTGLMCAKNAIKITQFTPPSFQRREWIKFY